MCIEPNYQRLEYNSKRKNVFYKFKKLLEFNLILLYIRGDQTLVLVIDSYDLCHTVRQKTYFY